MKVRLVVKNSLEIIDRALCERFELAWLQGDPLRIEDAIQDTVADDILPTLEELVRIDMEYRWRVSESASNGGTEVDAPPIAEDYLHRFPEIADPERVLRILRKEKDLRVAQGLSDVGQFAERFPSVVEVESPWFRQTLAGAQDRTQSFDSESSGGSTPTLGEFGNYDLLEVLGEGGMGVIYRARQKGANRDVALKVIRADRHASGDSRREKANDRFRTEAQAAARLEHENIVSVYDVGQVEEHLFFAMRLIEGESLKELVQEKPMENRRAATYLLGAAHGMAEAHRNGILHRDLKPHNIMVDRRSDRPMIADFGLAKVVESDNELTRSGEVLGTPSYMPPEQIGDSSLATELSDVYALGATLYHLLTGRPPFQAPHTISTMRQVIYEDPVAPSRLNREVDLDLNTICLKCLEKEPHQRYASVKALADDLQHYLRGEPIQARPISRPERAYRWCKRNPLAAGLSGLTSMLAMAVFLSVLIGYQQTSQALETSEQHFALAKDTVDELYTEASEIDLKDAPGMQPLKEKLLTRSLNYYLRMIEERGNQPELTDELAENHFRVGSIISEIGTLAAAEPQFVRAAELQRSLLEDAPKSESLRLALGNSLNELGRVRLRTDRFDAAANAFRESEAIRQQLVDEFPGNIEYQRKLANIKMNVGLLDARRGEGALAEQQYAAAQKIRQNILSEQSNDEVAEDFAKGSFNLGVLALQSERYGDASNMFKAAIQNLEPLVEKNPESLSTRFELAMSYFMLADTLQLRNEPTEALEYHAASQSSLQLLTDENPRVNEYRQQLVSSLMGQAQLRLLLGQQVAAGSAEDPNAARTSQSFYEQAERALLQAEQELQLLRTRDPDVSANAYDHAVVLEMLGDIQLAFNNFEDARRYFENAKSAMSILQPEFDDVPEYQEQWDLIEASLQQLGQVL